MTQTSTTRPAHPERSQRPGEVWGEATAAFNRWLDGDAGDSTTWSP